MVPNSSFGRAHFYAPVKKIGSLHIDTFYFNLIFIWIITIIAYFLLYFDTLRKTLKWISRTFGKYYDKRMESRRQS